MFFLLIDTVCPFPITWKKIKYNTVNILPYGFSVYLDIFLHSLVTCLGIKREDKIWVKLIADPTIIFLELYATFGSMEFLQRPDIICVYSYFLVN